MFRIITWQDLRKRGRKGNKKKYIRNLKLACNFFVLLAYRNKTNLLDVMYNTNETRKFNIGYINVEREMLTGLPYYYQAIK